ncbi:NTP transferase domain-containing protein [Cellulomonas iranensis]|uniref:phosphocholine cytidylyltransferase family protein n=1 Tax=Cellulomonas iranensis TaxID=76862 RepID=UPI003D7EE4F5
MSERRAVLLCAGRGTRARDVTDGLPKCLLTIDGVSLVRRVLSQLAAQGVDDVHVVVGHRRELVEREVRGLATTHVVHDYATSNNLWTLAAHAELLHGHDTAVIFGDVVVDDPVMTDLWEAPGDLALLVDTTSRLEGTMRVLRHPDGRVELGNQVPTARCDGNYVGIMRASATAAGRLADAVRRERDAGRGRDDYFTSVLHGLTGHLDARLVPVARGSWAEIDTPEDHRAALARFSRTRRPATKGA